MSKSPSINVPGPSDEERALQAEQTQILREQRDILSEQIRQQNLLSPLLFESAGIKPIFGEPGQQLVSSRDIEGILGGSTGLQRDVEQSLIQRGVDPDSPEFGVELAREVLRDPRINANERVSLERLIRQTEEGPEQRIVGFERLPEEVNPEDQLLKDIFRRSLELDLT